MSKYYLSEQAKLLFEALVKSGIDATSEYWDGHKHIDIAIKNAQIFIEVDGLHHYTDPRQIEADFKRDHFSDGDHYNTIRIPNIIIDQHLNKVVSAIKRVVDKRLDK